MTVGRNQLKTMCDRKIDKSQYIIYKEMNKKREEDELIQLLPTKLTSIII